MKKKIIILDDEPLIPILIKEMIAEEPGFEISQITDDKSKFLENVKKNSFDIALIDVSVGGREGGIEILQILKSESINLPSIMLSAHDERIYALKCLQSGAKGYISKNRICADLINGLTAIFSGHPFVSGERGESILKQYQAGQVFIS